MTIRVFKQGNEHKVVRLATVDTPDQALATVYRDGSYDVHSEPETIKLNVSDKFDIEKDTILLSEGDDVQSALDVLDEKLGEIVPKPKPIYTMTYENSKGQEKQAELMGRKVVDNESAVEFGNKVIADWSQDGKYDLKFKGVHTEPKGTNVGLAQPVELSAEDLADLTETEELAQ